MSFFKNNKKEILVMALFLTVCLAMPVFASQYAENVQKEAISIIATLLFVAVAVLVFKLFSKGLMLQAILSIIGGVVLIAIISNPQRMVSVGEAIVNKIFQ